MSNRTAKMHTFQRYITRLQEKFGIAQSSWFWMASYNAIMQQQKTYAFPVMTTIIGKCIAAKLFLDHIIAQGLPITEAQVCQFLHLRVSTYRDQREIIQKLQPPSQVKPLPQELTRNYISSLPIPNLTPETRAAGLRVFEKYGSWLLVRGYKPIFIALAVFYYLDSLNPRPKFHLYRIAAEYGVSISQMYRVSHHFTAELQRRIQTGSNSSSTRHYNPRF